MLWRLEETGVDVGQRWAELAEKSAQKTADGIFVFHDAHYAMALAADNREAELDALFASMRAAAQRNDTTQGPIFAAIGLPLCEAIAALRKRDYGTALDRLAPIRREIFRIGGSHAQRDVFARMFVAAALGAGRYRLARAALAERTALNPNGAWNWTRTAEALDGLNDAAGAAEARARAAKLLAA